MSLASRLILGLATAALFIGGQPAHAQTTIEPLYFCGVVGSTSRFLTRQGDVYTFPAGARPTRSSLEGSSLAASQEYLLVSTWNQFNNVETLWVAPRNQTFTEPRFEGVTLEYRNGSTPVGNGDLYVIVFSTAEHRDAFFYYLEKRDASPTEAEYVYFQTLSNYEFWIGQENEGFALYAYYTGIADYIVLTNPNARQAEYQYWYYRGLGAYYYFLGVGDPESAQLAFAYHYMLAVEAITY